jgi:hypothetical protein
MKKTSQVHFKETNHQIFVKQLQKYSIIFLEAVGLNEGFRQETDAAFATFWEREGDSVRKQEIIDQDGQGNILCRTLLGDLIEKPDSDPFVLSMHYCFSPEARQVQQRYGLLYPYHYNQSRLFASPGQMFVCSLNDADEFVREIEGKPVTIFRSPCLQAIREKAPDYLHITVNLFWPKEEIKSIFELVLDKALDERKSAGKKAFTRGVAVDPFPLKAWYMNKKQGKTPWKITQELYSLKDLTAKKCIRKNCPEKLEFDNLPIRRKKTYANKSCGKKDSCLIAKAHLKNIRDAIVKAERLISSIRPIS